MKTIDVTTWVTADSKSGQVLSKVLTEHNSEKLVYKVSRHIKIFQERIKALKDVKAHKAFFLIEAHKASKQAIFNYKYPTPVETHLLNVITTLFRIEMRTITPKRLIKSK